MLIQTHHDRHIELLATQSPAASSIAARNMHEASSPTHRIPSDTVGTSYSNGRPRGL